MDLLAAEEEIVARLKDRMGVDLEIRSFPDEVETFDFIAANGAILVRFNASEYAAPVFSGGTTDAILQERSVQWSVTILHRNLKEHSGIYSLLEGVRKALTGFSLESEPEATLLFPIRDRFVKREPQKWIYEIVFSHRVSAVEG
ncbi:MAG: Gp37 family protein [Fibrobacteria bacterium]